MSQGFNPYAPPQPGGYAPPPMGPYAPQPGQYPGWGGPQYQVSGTDLVAVNGAWLPDVCLKCGAQVDIVRKRRSFAWAPPWVYFLVLLHVIIAAIAIAIVQKRAALDVPLCRACDSRWTTARVVLVLTVLSILLVVLTIGVVAASNVFPSGVAALFAIVLVVGWLVGVIVVSRVFVRGRTLWPRRIENNYVTLAGVHPDALMALSQPMAPPAAAYGYAPAPGGFSGRYGV